MLRAVYKCGSSIILPKNHRDLDILKVYDTREEVRLALKERQNAENDLHFVSLDLAPKVFFACYQYPFMELIEGEEIPAFKKFSIFEHEEEYFNLIHGLTKWVNVKSKWWYHFYIVMCMFQNKKMKLTKKQTETAQEIHDNGVSSEMRDIIVDFFNKKSY